MTQVQEQFLIDFSQLTLCDYKQLSQPTTDDIEMRVCRDVVASNEDIAIEMVELFV